MYELIEDYSSKSRGCHDISPCFFYTASVDLKVELQRDEARWRDGAMLVKLIRNGQGIAMPKVDVM